MAEPIIKVDNISKRYRIGLKEQMSDSIGGAVMSALKYPVRNFRKLSQLSNFDSGGEDIFWALQNISFSLDKGDVLGVVGKNGAGKSTLLKILSRITLPTEGKIAINGRIASLLEVGTGFHNDLTGRENTYLNGTILGMKKKEIDLKFDEIVDFSGIEKFIDTPVKRYSSGMTVRLAFAVAAHLEPEILIIDEVLAVGDAEFQKKCLGKMQDVAGEGKTVLFVSHNMQAIQSLCNRAILLEQGRLKKEGATHDVISFYLSKNSKHNNEKYFENIETAEGNDHISLRMARVSRTNSNDNELFFTDTPITLEIEFWNKMPGAKLNLSLVLSSLKGEVIFNVTSESKNIAEGLHKVVFFVPGDLLNDNTYYIDLYFVKDQTEVMYINYETLVFEVHDAPREGSWYGKWTGAIRPKLKSDFYKVN